MKTDETDSSEKLGPLLVAPESYLTLRKKVRNALGFPNERLPLLIGIDGADGSGKSSVAAWLSWQLEMPAIHLDVYLVRDSNPLEWRVDDLSRAIDGAQFIPKARPVIVEGVFLLDVLSRVDRTADYYVFVEKSNHTGTMEARSELRSYIQRAKVKADWTLTWSSEEYDARVLAAHACRDL